jgi:hypothetical protein
MSGSINGFANLSMVTNKRICDIKSFTSTSNTAGEGVSGEIVKITEV